MCEKGKLEAVFRKTVHQWDPEYQEYSGYTVMKDKAKEHKVAFLVCGDPHCVAVYQKLYLSCI